MRAVVFAPGLGLALAFALVLTPAGCDSRANPCANAGDGICIAAHIKGNATGLQQLLIGVDKLAPQTIKTPADPRAFSLPIAVAIVVPASTSGTVRVAIDGLDGSGAPVAHTEQPVELPAAGHVDVDFILDRTGAAPPDMAIGFAFSGATDQTAYELDPLSLSLAASYPGVDDLVLTTGALPTGATFTATGASATLAWTPTLAQAGSYPITLTATSAANPARTATQMFTVVVKNTIDPMLNPFSVSPDQLLLSPIGDFDGDGLDDFAYCTNGATGGGPPAYSVQVIFGDKSGLPTARPYPADRTRTVMFSGPAGSKDSLDAPFAQCTGGDFDGDGKSDVLITDSFYIAPAAAAAAPAYFLLYGRARDDNGAPVTAQLTGASGGVLGGALPVVGDWDGDGTDDFAAFGAVPNPGTSATATVHVWTGGGPRKTGPSESRAFTYAHLCGDVAMIGFAGLRGNNSPSGHKVHPLVWYDDAVTVAGDHQTAGTCAASNGGLRVLTNGTQVNGVANVSIKRDIFPLPFAICDLDSDGKDDLIAENSDPDTHMWSVAVAYGTVDGWASPVDVTKSVMTGVMGNAPRVTCWPNSYAPGKFLVSDPGSLTSQGFLADGTVWFYDVDANQAPLLTKTLVNFDPNTNLSGFGKDLVPAGDYNGDGKPDLIIGYQAGFGGLTAAWLLYGR